MATNVLLYPYWFSPGVTNIINATGLCCVTTTFVICRLVSLNYLGYGLSLLYAVSPNIYLPVSMLFGLFCILVRFVYAYYV